MKPIKPAGPMTDAEMRQLFHDVRASQRRYYETRKPADLERARQLERLADDVLSRGDQLDLFDAETLDAPYVDLKHQALSWPHGKIVEILRRAGGAFRQYRPEWAATLEVAAEALAESRAEIHDLRDRLNALTMRRELESLEPAPTGESDHVQA